MDLTAITFTELRSGVAVADTTLGVRLCERAATRVRPTVAAS